jgi:hypothetical protein
MRAHEIHRRALAVAGAQAGVLSLGQLTGFLGLSRAQVREQVVALRWRRVYRGVYAVHTGELTFAAQCWAAHLLLGEDSALAGHTALHIWGVIDRPDAIKLVIPDHQRAKSGDMLVKRVNAVPPTKEPPGFPPSVIVEHALLEVATSLGELAAADLIGRTLQRRQASLTRLRRAMDRPRLRYRGLIEDVLSEFETGNTSPLESRGSKRVLKDHGLPLGEAQVRQFAGGRQVVRDRVIDGLVIEFDGRLGHSDPRSRLRDMDRDNAALLSGHPTLRFGWYDVNNRSCEAADQVAAVLSQIRGSYVGTSPCAPTCRSNRR